MKFCGITRVQHENLKFPFKIMIKDENLWCQAVSKFMGNVGIYGATCCMQVQNIK